MPQRGEVKIDDYLGDSDQVVPAKYEITSYGADFLVDGLIRRLMSGDIYIPTFQRGFVWNYGQASRFIESLLLGLPVPGIFLSKDYDTQKLLVIDGQQRLETLRFFYEGVFADTGKVFALRGVQKQFDRLTYKTLSEEDRRRLDDSILHATIVQQETPPEDDSSIYHIFERINTSGTALSPQEIRSCIYHGEFNDLLRNLNREKAWRSVYGNINKRMRDQELILRFFALYFYSEKYSKPMREFLNYYMVRNRHLGLQSVGQLTEIFMNTVGLINESLGNKAFRYGTGLNAAVFDSVMVGVARRLERGGSWDGETFQRQYRALLRNKEYVDLTLSSTADEINVAKRMDIATKAFASGR
jgi:hypothetical protein